MGQKQKICLRADASASMGVGHVMRMMALGQMLVDQGYEVHFATNVHLDNLKERLGQQGFVIHDCSPKGSWDIKEDIRHMLNVLSKIQSKWVVIDGNHFTADYERTLKDQGFRIVRIVDVPKGHYCADIVHNQNYGAQAMAFDKDPDTKLLAGLKHVLLRREFRKLPRPVKAQADVFPLKVLVSLGGSALLRENLSNCLNQALNTLPEITLVQSNDQFGAEEFYCSMLTVDMAIVSGGTTMWELMALQVPFMAISFNEAQKDYLDMLERDGLCVHLGFEKDLSVDKVRTMVKVFAHDNAKRERMAKKYATLIDVNTIGKGLLEELERDVVCN